MKRSKSLTATMQDYNYNRTPARARTPRTFISLIIVALLLKLAFFVAPYFASKGPPSVVHHEDGTGFAVVEVPGGYSYVSAMPAASTPTLDGPQVVKSSLATTTTTTQAETTTAASGIGIPNPSGRRFKTQNVVVPQLEITRTGETAPGLLFVGPRGNGTSFAAPMIIDEEGQLIWAAPDAISTNLKLQTYKGKQHITYWEGTSAFTYGHGYGSVRILDDTYQEVAKICPKDLEIVTELPGDEMKCLLDMHESYLSDRGTLIVTAYNVTRTDLSSVGGPEDGWAFDSLFYEIDIETQEVLFRWSVLDHVDDIPINITKYPTDVDGKSFGSGPDMPFDFFHINAVQPLDDGFLVNSRHTWSIFKLDQTGSVEWRFSGDDGGDFRLGDGIAFSWQHHARLHNITASTMRLTLFNNANAEVTVSDPKPSQGLEIFLDLDTKEALLLTMLQDKSDPRYAEAMGSVQLLPNDHTLIGYGKDPTFKEYDHRTEAVVYSANFGSNKSHSDVVASYRVYKYEWSARPTAAPVLVAEYSKDLDETHLYVSWNGATPDVFDGWTVEAGPSSEGLRAIPEKFPRTGFETVIPLAGRRGAYRATARLGTAQVGRSEAVVPVDEELG